MLRSRPFDFFSMIKKSKYITLPLLVILLVLPSCNKERIHPFQIINNSGYDIQILSFSGAIKGNDLALNSGDTSSDIILSYEKRFRLTPKNFCISIDDFTDTNGTFSAINRRPCLPFNKNDLNDEMNTITITSSVDSGTLTFELELN